MVGCLSLAFSGFGFSGVFFQFVNIPLLQFLAGPGGFAEERQAGFDAGIVIEAADADMFPEIIPAVALDHFGEDLFQSDAVQRIFTVHANTI